MMTYAIKGVIKSVNVKKIKSRNVFHNNSEREGKMKGINFFIVIVKGGNIMC